MMIINKLREILTMSVLIEIGILQKFRTLRMQYNRKTLWEPQ